MLAATAASSTHAPRRQAPATSACDTCRKGKTKCSGERPSCRRCARRSAFRRHYHGQRDRDASYEEFYHVLRTLPEQDAQHVVARVRSGADVTTIVNHVKAGDLLLQLAAVPETRMHSLIDQKCPRNWLGINPYLKSIIYESSLLYTLSNPTAPSSDPTQPPGIKLSTLAHAAKTVEPRLSDIRPSLWTLVCTDDVLMRDLFAVFFRCEYHFTAAFYKDLFLEDMIAQQDDFCSSLLVNVCYPQFSDRAEYWNPNTLVYRLLAEAKRLWELEATMARITTIQAGILFNVIHNLCSLNEIGQVYKLQGLKLAHELRLFKRDLRDGDARLQRGIGLLAWALFNWETLVAFSSMIPPLLTTPPDYPLPDIPENAAYSPSPSHFGQVLRAKSQFKVVMNDFCHIAYSKGSKVTAKKANSLRSQLSIYIYYYNQLLAIYVPLLNQQLSIDEDDIGPTAKQIIQVANNHIQTLIRLYYLRHGYDHMDLFIVIPLAYTGFECLDAIGDKTSSADLENLWSTLILVANGLYNQQRNHYLAEPLFRVIKGRMRPQEANLVKSTLEIEDETDDQKDLKQAVRSHWPVSVVKKEEDIDAHILSNLVGNYAYLNVEDKAHKREE
ncbi:putative C6 transcription factor [Xylariaceae sp. FL1272]|nr:putative C6 transcription factor [Xylariaceae sp. FL1272]